MAVPEVTDQESTDKVAVCLPSELQDIIIEKLLDLGDSYLLLASVVCRDWRNRSYERAFSTVCFNSRSIPAFVSFLDNPFSRSAIFSRVRHLRILGDGEAVFWSPSLINDLVNLLRHLAQIGRISALTLDNLTWAVLDPALVAKLTELRVLERLSMHRIYSVHLERLSDFVARFRLLRAFDLQNVECPARSDGWNLLFPGRLTPYEPGHCVSLNASGTTCSKRLTWVYSKHISREQRHLSSIYGAQVFCGSLTGSDLLRVLGPLLARLDINSSENLTADDSIASLDISANTSIRHLHLSSPGRVLSMIFWLPSFLANVKSLTLKTLHISFAQSRQFHLDRPFLKHIAGILHEPQYQRLELIEFIAFSPGCGRLEDDIKKEIIRCIRSCLPSWDKKGILAFSFH